MTSGCLLVEKTYEKILCKFLHISRSFCYYRFIQKWGGGGGAYGSDRVFYVNLKCTKFTKNVAKSDPTSHAML